MISIIITSWKEPKTIGRAIECIAKKSYSGIPDDFEIIQVSPDKETLEEGLLKAKVLGIENHYTQIKDPQKGKPIALNMASKQAKGDIILLTDGDVYWGENAVTAMIDAFKDKSIGGATGRPIAINNRNTQFGYYACLLADAAHNWRTKNSKNITAMSGYIMGIRRSDLQLPEDVLADDGYISHSILQKGLKISYVPKATAYIKGPETLDDYYKQKVRSLGGSKQLQQYDISKGIKNERSLTKELKYLLFPTQYAKNIKELAWSLLLYPIRLITWVKILQNKRVRREDKSTGWERIQSTKAKGELTE